MARSLNRVQLIGNLTRDPELRYTPNGTAVCSFSIATNRSWTTDAGEKREEADFHRIIAWSKLAELCSQFLAKGRKVYVEGRLSTRSWTAQDGLQKQTTEVVIDDMILLDSKRSSAGEAGSQNQGETMSEETGGGEEASSSHQGEKQDMAKGKKTKKEDTKVDVSEAQNNNEEVAPDDIPF